MKFIEWNSREIFITTEGELWQKSFLWVFGILSLLYFFYDGVKDFWHAIVGISVSSIFFLLPELFYTIRFDIEANRVFRNANLLGLKFLKVEAPIDTSKIVFKIESAGGASALSAYLETDSGKRVRLHSFFSQDKARMFVRKIAKYAPIQYKF